jgi:hypothetical protein
VPSGKVHADVKVKGGIRALVFRPDSGLLAGKTDEEIAVWRIPRQWLREK